MCHQNSNNIIVNLAALSSGEDDENDSIVGPKLSTHSVRPDATYRSLNKNGHH